MSEYSKTYNAKLVSVHVGKTIEFIKDSIGTAQVELDGFVGDKHRSYMRGIYEGEAYPPGTIRRNNRQWSAVSLEELEMISESMDLAQNLTPGLDFEPNPLILRSFQAPLKKQQTIADYFS